MSSNFIFFASPGNMWNFPIIDQPETPAVEVQWLKLSFSSLKKVFGADGSEPIASTLYEHSEIENVYLVYSSGDGIIVSWTVDASEIEGGLRLSLLSPDTGTGRGVRVLSLTIEYVK